MENKKVILIILDGWGHGQNPEVDAIKQANTPFTDGFYQQYPNAELITYGEQVGLPEGQMGNSEVGHMNIGAGRVVYQELARINKAVRERTLHQNETLLKALQYAKANNKSLHLMGLVSDGGVHSHINHLKALCDITQEQGLEKVYIHAFMDGRDTSPNSGLGYLKEVEQHIENQSVKLASIIGRYYAMDRDNRWERIQLAYDLLVKGEGEVTEDWASVIQARYDAGETDEFLYPIFCKNGSTIQADDVVVFFNFRTDRPRQITAALTQKNIPELGMQKMPLHFVTMTRYDESFNGIEVLFSKDDIKKTLGEVLAQAGKSQVRIAETEKYPHVTFFFSGGRENEFEKERRLLVASPKVATYDLQPEMSAQGITDAIVKDIRQHQPDFICLNYANTDMVGHTGVFEAAKKAAEVVDQCMKELISTCLEFDYDALVIADHGNSDYMINDDGTPHTAHTLNPVPCFYISNQPKSNIKNGKLADIAPTILALMGITQPQEMDGESLLV